MIGNSIRLALRLLAVVLLINGCTGGGSETDISELSNTIETSQPGIPVPAMVTIPAGCFDIGSPEDEIEFRPENEGPQKNICLTEFRMAKNETTFSQYDAFANATQRELPDDEGWGRGNRPVINVSWIDATEYAEWLTAETGKNYRLPTEAEWEYAGRGGTNTPFYTGVSITSEQANYDAEFNYAGSPGVFGAGNGIFRNQTTPVGQFASNAFGLFDIHGNVYEMTCSSIGVDFMYDGTEQVCTSGSRGERIIRGGSWLSATLSLRIAIRTITAPARYSDVLGFRIVQGED